MPPETIGSAIRRLRLEADFTLRGFAEEVGISAAYQSDIELDRRDPTERVLKEIARILSKRVKTSYEELQSLSSRIAPDLQKLVQETPEFGQLLREVKQSGRPASEVLKELQEYLREQKDPEAK